MTSNPNATLDPRRSRDDSSSSPIERRTTSSTLSGSTKGYSVASSETGESSRAGSNRNSLAALHDGTSQAEDHDGSNTEKIGKDNRGNHRSHRSRNSGGFLLSNSNFHPPTNDHLKPDTIARKRSPPRDRKGKAVIQKPGERHRKRNSNTGLGIGSSPLAANVTSAVVENGSANIDGPQDDPQSKPPLDVDSAQIVNLALNLSESRRNAARRNVSSPLPPLASAFGEGFSGGSLRQHMQQQRRVSRNVSPKPRASTASPRGMPGQAGSPLHANFENNPDGEYQYHFTASTLARAEKARTQIELMYHYRRLLEFVPPLKPNTLERYITSGSSIPNSPSTSLSASRVPSNVSATNQQIGRQYNPLQYIRNRKVRARERKAIDGEAQGFGDLDKVTSWVDQISKEAANVQASNIISMPVFSKEAELAASPHASPQTTLGKSPTAPVKVKRPRIDWDFNPADMLADVFWLEQDGNKRVVEDRFGRKVFPQTIESKKPALKPEETTPQSTPDQKRPMSPDLRIDTKLPEFRSMKADNDRHSDSTTARVRHKIRDATRIHHGHHGSSREAHHLHRVRTRSASDSSDTDGIRRRRRSATTDSHDRGRDILEKQMMELLAKEARETTADPPLGSSKQPFLLPVEDQKTTLNDGLTKSRSGMHSRTGSIAEAGEGRPNRDSLRNGSSGRPSLEVPGGNPRLSLEELDTTAPNSPQTQAAKLANTFVPSITMDLSPPQRQNSPSRNPLSRVKSKINPFEHSRTRSRGRADTSETNSAGSWRIDEQLQETPQTPDKRKRSTSPIKKVISRKTDDTAKSSRRGSLRRGKTGDESSGIRGLFKGNRGPVARVSDFIWKKDTIVPAASSGYSTDDSDHDEGQGRQSQKGKGSRDSSTGQLEDLDDDASVRNKPTHLHDLPTFTSQPHARGRTSNVQGDEVTDGTSDQRQAREERRRASRANLLETPPRIDIHGASPASSPELRPADSNRDSSVSDIQSRRASFASGVHTADARLNYVLGMSRNRRPSAIYGADTGRGTRPSLEGQRQWSISDRGVSVHCGPMTKREIARVRTLLLSSGIKAKEISRRAAANQDLYNTNVPAYTEVVKLARNPLKPVPKCQEHKLAARILSDDIQLSKELWKSSADVFCNTTIQDLVSRIEELQTRIVETLTPMARQTADEADEVSKDLVTSQTLKVKRVTDTMDKMLRRRRRRFRWLRRGGWVMVEWALVGFMWIAWLLVVLVRIIMGTGRGLVAATRWLLWL